jgi:hypothetical protein
MRGSFKKTAEIDSIILFIKRKQKIALHVLQISNFKETKNISFCTTKYINKELAN